MAQDSSKILAQNITDLVSRSGKQLIEVHGEAARLGFSFNYPQLTKIASAKSDSPRNPTLDTIQKIVDILRVTIEPDLELWMLLKDGYFSEPRSASSVSADVLQRFIEDFMLALTTMKVVSFTKEQHETALNVGKFCSLKYAGSDNQREGDLLYTKNQA